MEERMTPKHEDKKEPPSGNGSSSPGEEMEVVADEEDLQLATEDDLQEIAAINENLDNLNSVLDTIEQRADDMKAKLMELLLSNREIMRAMKEEQATAGGGEENKCNHPPGKPAEEA